MTDDKKLNYPSNSFKSRSKVIAKAKTISRPQQTASQGGFLGALSNALFGEDAKNVVTYVIDDVLIPATKSTISDMITNGIDMLLYGEPRSRNSKKGSNGYVNYTSFFGKPNHHDSRRLGAGPAKPSSRYNFEEIIFDTAAEAQEVLDNLVEMLEQYGTVSVADFMDSVGFDSEYTDNKYGWKNLSRAMVKRVRSGCVLYLPKPIVLD